MLTQKVLAGLVLAALAGAVMITGGANAQSGAKLGTKAAKLRLCQQECAGDPGCLQACGSQVIKAKAPPQPPRTEPEPPVVKDWRDQVFEQSKGGAGGGGGGR
jgi:hypothetical protein